jgi:YidC/Oxa1 family membrane protein insertase
MENHRILLYFTLFFIMYLLWAEWQMDYGPRPVDPVAQTPAAVTGELPVATPEGTPEATPVIEAQPEATTDQVKSDAVSRRIQVITDVVDLELDTRGGDVRRVTLRNYAVEADEPEIKLDLLSEKEGYYHIAQSGLVSVEPDSAPNHNTIYNADQTQYRLGEGENELKVPLYWTGPDGVRITKTFIFRRAEYVIDVEYHVTAGQKDWSGNQYMQLVRKRPSEEGESMFIRTYTGGVVFNDEIKYVKLDFEDLAEENTRANIGADACLNQKTGEKDCELQNGWLAMIQHYFLAAWIPEPAASNLYYSRYNAQSGRYSLGARTPAKKIAAGEQVKFNSRFVAGPKLQSKLEEVEPGLELTVDYGILTIIAKPLFWLLDIFHGWFNNWGWAIIFLTITVKALFYKLSEMSYKSMAKMRKVAPRIKLMKEQYGDDRQAMSKAMMDMYKREKINPMGGCFPILVQIPVFISLYWVLLESVEMRHAPFILWIENLSAMDPYFVLPLIMGVSMYIQQKLNPAPIDPVQQKVFQIMPFAFTIMFAFFPAGLVLYWVVNNILSIAQQWVITRRIENS